MLKRTNLIFVAFVALLSLNACTQTAKETDTNTTAVATTSPFQHPEWINDKVIYEVNLRQYSQKGSFDDFKTHLSRLKQLGVDILWFMPIHPIGEKNRKGSLGSYYAVRDYKAVNPEFGTFDDFKKLVDEAHAQGFSVIIDLVANHTAPDNVWVEKHPEWYTRDEKGNFVAPVADWADVIDLNYDNQEMRAAMIDAMKFWVRDAGIDGYRCDVAGMVPLDFWQAARTALDSIKPVFMLAEAEEMEYHEGAFDMSYGWEQLGIFNQIAQSKKSVASLDSFYTRQAVDSLQHRYRMLFTSNHDENTWNGTEFERMGEGAKTFAVLAATLPGMPLIYNGQEIGLQRRLKFFEKDPIKWISSPYTEFYTQLTKLRKTNTALFIGKNMTWIERLKTGADDKVFAFRRQNDKNAVVVITNLTAKAQKISIDAAAFPGDYTELFSNGKKTMPATIALELKPWEYLVWYK